MQAVPQTCDLMIVHGYVLTMDSERRVFPDGAIAVRDKRIVAVGPTRTIEVAWRATRRIDAAGGTVHPGFIDGHYHANLHLTRGALSDNPKKALDNDGSADFPEWLNALTDEDEYASTLLAAAELVRNGFTGFVDASTSFSADAVASASEAVGIRVSVTEGMLWDVVGADPMSGYITRAPCDGARARKELGSQLKRNRDKDSLVRGHVALYGNGCSTDELMREAKALADREGAVFHQHQNFAADDAAFDRQRFGKPAMVHFAEQGLIGPSSVFTHMNILEPAEVEAVAESGMALVWHPGNVMYYGISQECRSAFPQLIRGGTSVAFGTDVAKAWPFGELGFIAYLVSREWNDFVPCESILEIFTLGGARAFGFEAEIGSLEAGKRADIVIRTNDLPDAQPNFNVVRQLVLVSRTKGVDTVVCNGEIVVRHGRLTRLDESEIYEQARQSVARVTARLDIKPKSTWPLHT